MPGRHPRRLAKNSTGNRRAAGRTGTGSDRRNRRRQVSARCSGPRHEERGAPCRRVELQPLLRRSRTSDGRGKPMPILLRTRRNGGTVLRRRRLPPAAWTSFVDRELFGMPSPGNRRTDRWSAASTERRRGDETAAGEPLAGRRRWLLLKSPARRSTVLRRLRRRSLRLLPSSSDRDGSQSSALLSALVSQRSNLLTPLFAAKP